MLLKNNLLTRYILHANFYLNEEKFLFEKPNV